MKRNTNEQCGFASGEPRSDRCVKHMTTVETLMEIARALASPNEIQDILEQIMVQVSRLLKPKAWSLLLLDEVTGELEFAVAISAVGESLKGVRLPKGHGVAGWVAVNGESLIIPDVRTDPRFAAEFDQKLSFTTRSIACVPIKNQEQIFGVIELINSHEDGIFDEADERILVTIADFAGIAIANAKSITKIKQLVITDDLTGLYNSRYFFEQVDYEVARAKRYETPLSLVFFDLDRFKRVNDTYGHLDGSRLLAEVGAIVQKNIRKTDRAARYGGDEFVIILPQTEKAGARVLATKLLEALHDYPFVSNSGDRLKVTGSFGIASFPEDAVTASELINAADEAMYRVKETGRDGVLAAGKSESGPRNNR